MSSNPATLHMICGKIASGKSTLASALADRDGAVLLSEDRWLNALYADQMSSIADYARCASKLRSVMGPHVSDLLTAGASVVLDFPANTSRTRAWMRGILETTQVSHQLHVLTPPDAVCLARLRDRNARGAHPFAVTETQFWEMSKYFEPPSPEEGFVLVRHDPEP